MKQAVHPQYFDNAEVICSSCDNKFNTGSTMETIHVQLCYNCHPFYTGEQKFVDSASRIQKFQQKQVSAQAYQSKVVKKKEEAKKKDDSPKTLREMLLEVSKN